MHGKCTSQSNASVRHSLFRIVYGKREKRERDPELHSNAHIPIINQCNFMYWYWLKIVWMFFSITPVFQLVNDSFVLEQNGSLNPFICDYVRLCVALCLYICKMPTIGYIDLVRSICWCVREKPNNYSLNSNFRNVCLLTFTLRYEGSNG